MNKIYVNEHSMLDEFYKDWSLTFLGCIEEELPLYIDFIKKYSEMNDEDVYIVKGKLMNEHYNLTGDNRYQDDLTIAVVKLSSIKNVVEVAVPRFQIGGKWFTDIVDNNRMREMHL